MVDNSPSPRLIRIQESILERQASWVLRNIVKALDSGVGSFLNTAGDKAQLIAAKKILKERAQGKRES